MHRIYLNANTLASFAKHFFPFSFIFYFSPPPFSSSRDLGPHVFEKHTTTNINLNNVLTDDLI